ncbi:MAG: DMT family transporter [Granulosicoccus sp.]
MTRRRASLLLLIAGATWGMGFVAQAEAMSSIGPYLFIALRFLVATLVVLPFALRESYATAQFSNTRLSPATWYRFVLIGIVLFLGMATQQTGLLTTTVTNSGFLTGLYVIFTPVLVVIMFRESPHRIIWLAAAVALYGIFLLSGGNISDLVTGDYLTIASAGFWALQVVLIARFVGESGRPLALSFVQFAVTALLAGVLAIAFEPLSWQGIQTALPNILYAGVFASGFAFTLQVIGQRYTSAPQAAVLLSSEAPFAALFAFMLLGERIGWSGLVGCGLMLLAMLMVELVPAWMRKSTAITGSDVS